jgi:cytochrome c-type biogenesis protein CcmE
MSTPNTTRAILIVGALVIAGAFTYMLSGGIGSTLVYFYTPSELLAQGTKAYGAPVRLGGQVVPGSVQWDAPSTDLRFVMQDGKAQIAVHSHGAPPQMFRDGIGVVVEGTYAENGTFEANQLLVKHSNEYRPPKAGQQPQEMYKSLIKAGAP